MPVEPPNCPGGHDAFEAPGTRHTHDTGSDDARRVRRQHPPTAVSPQVGSTSPSFARGGKPVNAASAERVTIGPNPYSVAVGTTGWLRVDLYDAAGNVVDGSQTLLWYFCKPLDPSKSVDALVAAVERGEISRARIDSSVRRTLELTARMGVALRPIAPLDSLRDVVGAPAHRAMAMDIAQRAVTLLRDRDTLLPVAPGGRTVLVQYMPETELRAGRTFIAEVRAGLGGNGTQAFKIGPSTAACLTMNSRMMPMRMPFNAPAAPVLIALAYGSFDTVARPTVVKMSRGS